MDEDKQKEMAANQRFLARREVMVEALRDYYNQTHTGTNPQDLNDKKINGLIAAINRAAQKEGARLDEEGMSKVALEWEGFIRTKTGFDQMTNRFAKAQDALEFFEHADIKKAMTNELSNALNTIPKDYNIGADLDAVGANPLLKLGIFVALRRDKNLERREQVQDALENLSGVDAEFKRISANLTPPFIKYSEGETLSGLLDKHAPTPEQLKSKQAELFPPQPPVDALNALPKLPKLPVENVPPVDALDAVPFKLPPAPIPQQPKRQLAPPELARR